MANEAKQFTIGGVTHDVMDVGARQLITQLQAAIDAITSGDTTTAIKTFQEVIDFLDGVTDDATLIGKLNELRTLIAAKYSKPASGIPASDLADGVIPDVSGFATKTEVNAKANSADVVPNSRTVNGKALSSDVTIGMEDIQGLVDAINNAGNGAVSVTTNQDGTFTIHAGETDYTINLNHTHENMAKLVKCTEATLPQTMADDTIYVQVDNLTTPQEIEALHIFGLEFAGGGVPAGTPAITKPSGTTINLGENSGSGVSKTIEIKANSHITGDLTVGLAANSNLSFDTTNLPSGVTYNSGAGTLTIAQATAMQGVNITIVYSGSGAAEIDGGLVISGGGATPKSVVVVVVVELPYFPVGFLADTAWERVGEQLDVPDQVAGYCTNPFTEDFRFAHDSSYKFDLIIKGGFVKNNGELTRGKIMFKNTLEDTLTNSAYTKSAEPIRLNDVDHYNNTERYHYVSATFKTSEIADCYIYDNVAHKYLWAGKNVDKSVAPEIPNV